MLHTLQPTWVQFQSFVRMKATIGLAGHISAWTWISVGDLQYTSLYTGTSCLAGAVHLMELVEHFFSNKHFCQKMLICSN